MTGILLDTHSFLWYVEDSPRLDDDNPTARPARAGSAQPEADSRMTNLLHLIFHFINSFFSFP
jgi:hypothetical protein